MKILQERQLMLLTSLVAVPIAGKYAISLIRYSYFIDEGTRFAFCLLAKIS